jgi:flagellar biosynthesis protein FlhF
VAASDATPVLVLPAGMDVTESAELGLAYAEAGARLLVATRFDVARRLGGILAAASEADLALAEAGIGPGAADGLLPITPGWLAARLIAIPGPRAPA